MILYKSAKNNGPKRDVGKRTININIEEFPERPQYNFKTNKDRVKFIKYVETMIRSSYEYKEYMKFLKTRMDYNKCAILNGIRNENGKRYSIEIHHEPFNLFSLVDIAVNKRQKLEEPLNVFDIAEEIMEYHYSNKVGLIPLSKTMHELVTNGKIFIPLQYIYQDYKGYYEENAEFITPVIDDMLDTKIQMSLKCDKIQSNVLEPEFVYLDVDGFEFPVIPDSWSKALKTIEMTQMAETLETKDL